MTAPLLNLTNINKSFGPIDVLFDISLDVKAGEVLCLLGDNGAGKSTLIKILSGVHRATSGLVEMSGKAVVFNSPRDASDHGIATVHQFGGTFPLMSIGRSFFVGEEPKKGWGPFKRLDRKRANEVAVKAVRDLGTSRPPRLGSKRRLTFCVSFCKHARGASPSSSSPTTSSMR
jgi:simple sugar transport system ATP-binding protein